MSQTSRSKVRALERHRRAAARELAAAGCCRFVASGHLCMLDEFAVRCLLHEDGAVAFDVHAAREHAKTLAAMKRHEGVEAVADDWRRGLGREPDQRWQTQAHGATSVTRKTWCEPSGLPPGLPHNSMNWRSLARLGRRILDMLEGQPGACPRCEAWGSIGATPLCPICHGTGHNLRGKLPEVEWSPAVRCSLVDHAQAVVSGPSENRPSWKRSLTQTSLVPLTDDAWNERTRVCPRGEHGTVGGSGCRDRIQMRAGVRFAFDVAMPHPDAGRYDAHVRAWYSWKLPAWRRGEIEHARQRGEREARRLPRPGDVIAGARVETVEISADTQGRTVVSYTAVMPGRIDPVEIHETIVL